MFDPIELARRIYQQRVGRKIGSMASIAGIAGAGLLGLLRYHGAASWSFSLVTAAFAGGMVIGPIADRVARRLAGRSFERALVGSGGDEERAPIELRQKLRARALAASVESSEAWALAKSAVFATVSWLWLFGVALGDVGSTVGKALSYLMTHGGVSILLCALAAYLQGRSEKRALSVACLLAAMIVPAFTAHPDFLIALAVSGFYVGIAAVFVMFPAVWWTRRRMRHDRRALEQLALPPPTEDSDEVRRVLRTALEWEDGPPALRASALRELSVRLEGPELGPHLDRALTSGVAELRAAALELSRARRHRPPIDILLAIEDQPEAALLPPLLHRHRAPEIEPALLRLLSRSDPRISAAAAESLGLVGSLDSIAQLKEAARVGGRVASTCTEAIERIRIRHTCTPGQLALVSDPEVGALSDPSAEPAALSFAETER